MGHSTIEMTMRYSHLSPDARRQAVELLDVREAVLLRWTTISGVVLAQSPLGRPGIPWGSGDLGRARAQPPSVPGLARRGPPVLNALN